MYEAIEHYKVYKTFKKNQEINKICTKLVVQLNKKYKV